MKTHNNRKNAKQRKLSDTLLYLFGITFLLMLVGTTVGMLLELIPVFHTNDMMSTALVYLEYGGIWIVALLFIAITKRNRPILQILRKKNCGNTVSRFFFGLGLGFCLNLICIAPALIRGDIHITFRNLNPIALLFVFIAVFVQSSAEEFICRGFLYQRIMAGYSNPLVAVLGNAFFFMLFHIMNEGVTILSLTNIFLFGIFFSLIYICFDSIWCAMAAHAAWNYTQNILFGLPNSGICVPFSLFSLNTSTATNSVFYNVTFGVEGTIFVSLVLIAACSLFYYYGKKNLTNPMQFQSTTE